ncbi:MAG: hypothetical protein QE493_07680 [Verrucomicrobiae bacterium]|nr:hypothetical protein [Verrucomicrobiae bacterium]
MLLGQYVTHSRRRNPSLSLSASGFTSPRNKPVWNVRASPILTLQGKTTNWTWSLLG